MDGNGNLFSGNIYSRNSTPLTIEGYTEYEGTLYTRGSSNTILGYTQYIKDLYLGNGGTRTILAYSSYGTNVYKSGSAYSGYEGGSSYSYYASGDSATQQGERHSESHYRSGSTSTNVTYIGYGWYSGGSSITKRGGSRSGYNRGDSFSGTNRGGQVTGLYQRDSSSDETVNLRGTKDTTTLYYRDSTKDGSYYSISEYTGTLFYRDSSKDTSRYLAGSQLTFNPATISTQRVTALTV